jgi:hypothetical protein
MRGRYALGSDTKKRLSAYRFMDSFDFRVSMRRHRKWTIVDSTSAVAH